MIKSTQVKLGMSVCFGLMCLPLAGQTITIPDPIFHAFCVNAYDANGDGLISVQEAAAVDDGWHSMSAATHFHKMIPRTSKRSSTRALKPLFMTRNPMDIIWIVPKSLSDLRVKHPSVSDFIFLINRWRTRCERHIL